MLKIVPNLDEIIAKFRVDTKEMETEPIEKAPKKESGKEEVEVG